MHLCQIPQCTIKQKCAHFCVQFSVLYWCIVSYGADVLLNLWDWSTWWRHQMETFSALLAICAGNSPVPVNSPHKGQWRGALFSLICVWIDGWVDNREAGDVIRYCAHYDVIVMISVLCIYCVSGFQNTEVIQLTAARLSGFKCGHS